MILSRNYTFQAARKLTKVPDDHICSQMHGHTFKVHIKIDGKIQGQYDFVMDFFDIDKIFNQQIFSYLDHKCLNEIDGLENPTTELISIWIWDHLIDRLPLLLEVSVYEGDLYGCTYYGK